MLPDASAHIKEVPFGRAGPFRKALGGGKENDTAGGGEFVFFI